MKRKYLLYLLPLLLLPFLITRCCCNKCASTENNPYLSVLFSYTAPDGTGGTKYFSLEQPVITNFSAKFPYGSNVKVNLRAQTSACLGTAASFWRHEYNDRRDFNEDWQERKYENQQYNCGGTEFVRNLTITAGSNKDVYTYGLRAADIYGKKSGDLMAYVRFDKPVPTPTPVPTAGPDCNDTGNVFKSLAWNNDLIAEHWTGRIEESDISGYCSDSMVKKIKLPHEVHADGCVENIIMADWHVKYAGVEYSGFTCEGGNCYKEINTSLRNGEIDIWCPTHYPDGNIQCPGISFYEAVQITLQVE